MKTKAAVLYAIGQPLVIEELELEAPREKEILVKWVASGICHSDYSVRDGTLGLTLPAVLGHEGAGIVEAVGPGVTQLAVGVFCLLLVVNGVKAMLLFEWRQRTIALPVELPRYLFFSGPLILAAASMLLTVLHDLLAAATGRPVSRGPDPVIPA